MTKYAVDRVEGDKAILENLTNKKIIEINIKILPANIKDGNILVKKGQKFILDKDTEYHRREAIKNKFNNLIE